MIQSAEGWIFKQKPIKKSIIYHHNHTTTISNTQVNTVILLTHRSFSCSLHSVNIPIDLSKERHVTASGLFNLSPYLFNHSRCTYNALNTSNLWSFGVFWCLLREITLVVCVYLSTHFRGEGKHTWNVPKS